MTPRPALALGLVSVLVLVASCSPPPQRIEISTRPPGATVYLLDGAPPGMDPAHLPAALTPTADVDLAKLRSIGRTPAIFCAEAEEPFRLLVHLDGHERYEVAFPPREVTARIDVVLEPRGSLREEEAILEALLARGPLARKAIEKEPGGAAALERLIEKRLVDQVAWKPDAFDLGTAGLERLRERLGDGEVLARLLETRREAWRSAPEKEKKQR